MWKYMFHSVAQHLVSWVICLYVTLAIGICQLLKFSLKMMTKHNGIKITASPCAHHYWLLIQVNLLNRFFFWNKYIVLLQCWHGNHHVKVGPEFISWKGFSAQDWKSSQNPSPWWISRKPHGPYQQAPRQSRGVCLFPVHSAFTWASTDTATVTATAATKADTAKEVPEKPSKQTQ